MPTTLKKGRYQSLTEYVRENGLDYAKTRLAMLNGKSRKQHARVGRAWLVRA